MNKDVLVQLAQLLTNQAAADADKKNSIETKNSDDKKQSRQLAPVTAISKVAKRNFMKLPPKYQTAEGKRQALELAIKNDKKKRYPDAPRYWDDAEAEGRKLDRAQDLKEYCEAQHLNYTAVKQHLVIEGRGVIKDIVLNGIDNYKTLILKFGELLYDREKECPVTREALAESEEAANE